MKAIKITVEFKPYVPSPDSYPEGSSVKQMAEIDIGNEVESLLFENGDVRKVKYEIVDEDEVND